VLVGFVLVLAVGMLANIAGIWRCPGGPLREAVADAPLWLDIRGSWAVGASLYGVDETAGLDVGTTIYAGVAIQNVSPWPAMIERAWLEDRSEGIELIGIRLARPGTEGGIPGAVYDDEDLAEVVDYGPIETTLPGFNTAADGRLLVIVRATAPGHQQFRSVSIDYRVGPFSFRVFHRQGVSVCVVPLPSGTRCADGLYLE
jgi:hypothetical protein